jgi:fructose-bisphosphate aldolase class II
MKVAVAVISFLVGAQAFAPAFRPAAPNTPLKKVSEEFGIPCEDECALESYPNLPESVHPGVLSGQAMMDLLEHAKANGKRQSPPVGEASIWPFLFGYFQS